MDNSGLYVSEPHEWITPGYLIFCDDDDDDDDIRKPVNIASKQIKNIGTYK